MCAAIYNAYKKAFGELKNFTVTSDPLWIVTHAATTVVNLESSGGCVCTLEQHVVCASPVKSSSEAQFSIMVYGGRRTS